MRLFTALLILAASLLLFSCDSAPAARDEFKRSARVSAAGANDPEERLRDELGEFMVYFERTIARMENAAIRAADGDEEELSSIKASVLLIERKFTQAYAQSDPVSALIELWYDSYRLNAWRWEYERRHELLLQSTGISRILNRIREIARRWTQPEVFNELDERIRERANADEQVEDFVDPERMKTARTPVLVRQNNGSDLVSVLGLPFAPFKAAGSISQTAAEIGEEARRIADRVDRLPSDLGHQAEIIVLGVLASPQMESILEDLDQLSTDFERISTETEKIEDIVNGLPARVREEATLLLDSLQDRSEEMAAMNRSLNETLQNGGQTLDSLTKASQSLSQLAVQLERTSVVLDELFGFSAAVESAGGNDKDALLEVRATAEAIAETSRSLQDLVASPDLVGVIDRVDQSVENAAREADRTAGLIVDRVAWRLGFLLLIAFVLGGLLVLFMNRLRRS